MTDIEQHLATPNSHRIHYIRHGILAGLTVEKIHDLSGIDPWFLNQIRQIVRLEQQLATEARPLSEPVLRKAKQWGFSDRQIAEIVGVTEKTVRTYRKGMEIIPAYKLVDTCAAEFEAHTPYYYSAYELECEARPSVEKKVMIIGGGPNRIGQGIEFDYCCVHAAYALAEEGVKSIMVNSNPETVSTDYDTSDTLYFEPLTHEDVLSIVEMEKPLGVIVQFGGQTPLNLAEPLSLSGVPILGTQPDAIARAEDRHLFQELLQTIGLKQPANDTVLTRL